MEKEKKEKKSNWLLVTILIVALLASFAFGGLAVGLVKSPKGDTYITNTTAEKEGKEKAENKTVTGVVGSPIDYTKCINQSDENVLYSPSTGGFAGIKLDVEDEKNVRIAYNAYELNQTYNLGLVTADESSAGTYEKLDTKKFDKRIAQIKVGTFGQAAGNEIIFYLMEDGTIQFTPIYKELTSDNWKQSDNSKKFNSYGTIDGVSDIINITGVSAYYKNGAGWTTTIAQKADGSFYDLQNYVKDYFR